MNKKIKWTQKGITLISLVVTIIILITLVGISINLILGENGLINKAKLSKELTETAKRKEQIELMQQEAILSSNNISSDIINYSESIRSISNPDIGYYSYFAMSITDQSSNIMTNLTYSLSGQTELNQSLIGFFVNLENTSGAINGTADRAITDDELEKIDTALSLVRQYNKKVILRFRYVVSSSNKYKEPSMDIILQHIEQLGPIMQKNKDVITVVEAGFLGSSGEWYPTNYTTTENRQQIVFKLLDVLPKEIMVNVRTPNYYREIFDTQNPISEQTKYLEDYASRVGLHNDGYLGSETDLGTYGQGQRESELNWQNSHNQYTIFGGEASTDSSSQAAAAYSDSTNAISDMQKTHCTYLNRIHNAEVLNKWKNTTYNGSNREYKGQTAYKYIGDHLGYRYVLRDSRVTASTKQGERLEAVLEIENTGFANMVHEKKLELILEKDGEYYKAISDIDVRNWKCGTNTTVVLLYNLPKDIKIGEWNLYVKISDKLNENYCVEFANENVWDSVLKANYIGKTNIQEGTNKKNNELSQITFKDQQGTNSLEQVESQIIVDGKVSSKYEWKDEDILYSNAEDNTKFYMKNDENYLYLLIQSDKIKTDNHIRYIMRVKTEGYIQYGWWSISGKVRNPHNYIIVDSGDFKRLVDNSKGTKETIDSQYYTIRKIEKGIEYKISIDAIPGLKKDVEIDYIGFDICNSSWVVESEEDVINLHEDYKYTFK